MMDESRIHAPHTHPSKNNNNPQFQSVRSINQTAQRHHQNQNIPRVSSHHALTSSPPPPFTGFTMAYPLPGFDILGVVIDRAQLNKVRAHRYQSSYIISVKTGAQTHFFPYSDAQKGQKNKPYIRTQASSQSHHQTRIFDHDMLGLIVLT
jgi:hypothetical protein